MTTALTEEQLWALKQNQGHPIELIDPESQQRYVLIEESQVREVLLALKKQQDLEAIQEGVEDWKAGRVRPFQEFLTDEF